MKYFLPELKKLFDFELDEDGFVCGVWLKDPKANLIEFLGCDVVEALEVENELTY